MCRLFGLHAGGVTDAEFWLLEAPDSLSAQSHRNPDGAGIRRVFALITGETRRHGGDLRAGIISAVGWIAGQLPVYALNLVLAAATELWALRYPATHELYVLDRPPGGTGGPGGGGALTASSARINARSAQLARQPSVVIASERMDEDPAWRLLEPGELLHVGPGLELDRDTPFPAAPRHLLRLDDLDAAAASSQHPA